MSKFKIGVVTSRFNEEVTSKLEEGAIAFLEEVDAEIFCVKVPGAVEIPLACKVLLQEGCDGVVALGAVIRGETSHYDYVCNSVERGISTLMLETGKPIGFGVLTTENEEQAFDRVGGKHGHKGSEAAQVVVEMIGLLGAMKTEIKSSFGGSKPKATAKTKANASKGSSQKVTKKASNAKRKSNRI